ncbi:hypothetical protein TVAG_071040 [Trichomonas vaginalis G3]|uniref:Uncharacterized protein n=1 Tax=Trichomonas vaginalis (strain ATCC PRA-98 / G3) TaxID=412133 RepID=A2D807_TRIV3|nr:hypothetical protein TVAGG3_1045690 [Trichomonas vaginalis G3]EAY23440.1 hypothetical protein TVAG_071040 [Trichomonas vaginalis G3]KAI5493853.1 hypothetical protein TVAGG3_1045690 [Trichomonas vaginalis G3]|eukprot:XP_001584426.1 hypothetical protein [Trichomonas vaginalis G3]
MTAAASPSSGSQPFSNVLDRISLKRPKVMELEGNVCFSDENIFQFKENTVELYDKYYHKIKESPRKELSNGNLFIKSSRNSTSNYLFTFDSQTVRLYKNDLTMIFEKPFQFIIQDVAIFPNINNITILILASNSVFLLENDKINKISPDNQKIDDICVFINNNYLYREERTLHIKNIKNNEVSSVSIDIPNSRNIIKLYSLNKTQACVISQDKIKLNEITSQIFEFNEIGKYQASISIKSTLKQPLKGEINTVSLPNSSLSCVYSTEINFLKFFESPELFKFSEIEVLSLIPLTTFEKIEILSEKFVLIKKKEGTNKKEYTIFQIGHNENTIPSPYPLKTEQKQIRILPKVVQAEIDYSTPTYEQVPAPDTNCQQEPPQKEESPVKAEPVKEIAPQPAQKETQPPEVVPEPQPAPQVANPVQVQQNQVQVPVAFDYENFSNIIMQHLRPEFANYLREVVVIPDIVSKVSNELKPIVEKSLNDALSEIKATNDKVNSFISEFKAGIVNAVNKTKNSHQHETEEVVESEIDKVPENPNPLQQTIDKETLGNPDILGSSYVFLPKSKVSKNSENIEISISQFSPYFIIKIGEYAGIYALEYRQVFDEELILKPDEMPPGKKLIVNLLDSKNIKDLQSAHIAPSKRGTFACLANNTHLRLLDVKNDTNIELKLPEEGSDIEKVLSMPSIPEIYLLINSFLYSISDIRLKKYAKIKVYDFALTKEGKPIFVSTEGKIYNGNTKFHILPSQSSLLYFSIIRGDILLVVFKIENLIFMRTISITGQREIETNIIYKEPYENIYFASSLYSSFVCVWIKAKGSSRGDNYIYNFYLCESNTIKRVKYEDPPIAPCYDDEDTTMKMSSFTFINPGTIVSEKNSEEMEFSKFDPETEPILFASGECNFEYAEVIKDDEDANPLLQDHEIIRVSAWHVQQISFEKVENDENVLVEEENPSENVKRIPRTKIMRRRIPNY